MTDRSKLVVAASKRTHGRLFTINRSTANSPKFESIVRYMYERVLTGPMLQNRLDSLHGSSSLI